MCRLTDGPLFAVLSYLSGGRGGGGGRGDEFVVALLPVAEQRPVQLQVTPWPEADTAFELETSWRCSEALYDTWMESQPHKLQKPGDTAEEMQRSGGCGFFILIFRSLPKYELL